MKELDKVRNASKKVKASKDPIESKVGNNLLFWSDISKNNIDKVEELGDVILYLMRRDFPKMSYESESFVRDFQQFFINTIRECEAKADEINKPKIDKPKKDWVKAKLKEETIFLLKARLETEK